MVPFNKEDVLLRTTEYFGGDTLAADVWIKKYCLKNENGELLEISPDDMHRREARDFARIERLYSNPVSEVEIYQFLKNFTYFIPGGSQMSGIGNNLTRTSLSNCFVIESAVDSYGGIFKADEQQVQIMKRRGGVGHDISNLRPNGALANNSVLGGMAGSVLYMERFSNSTREVAQDGRRGALMLSMDVRHPDIDRFISSKLDTSKITGANISVKIRDYFIECLQEDIPFIQRFPVEIKTFYQEGLLTGFIRNCEEAEKNKLITLDKNVYVKKVDATEIWNKIVHHAWQSAEPGILFWDTILRMSPLRGYGKEWEETSTNPCGEIPLCPWDSCRLSSLNLYSYVVNPFTEEAYFDFSLFIKHVKLGQRVMDDLIDLEIEKIDQIIEKIKRDEEDLETKKTELTLWVKIRDKAEQGRRTGLGITAEGDMLAALGIQYGSEKSIEFCTEVHRVMALASYEESIDLAVERGACPIWNMTGDIQSEFLLKMWDEISIEYREKWETTGRRNIANLTIAPTGTISLMTQTTSGIEPLFQPFYKRRVKTDDIAKATFIDERGDGWLEYTVIHPKFIEWFRVSYYGKNPWEGMTAKRFLEGCHESLLQKYFEESPYYKSTANEIDWQSAVRLQGAVQQWIDHSISKTINLPSSATEEDVSRLYLLAHKVGCKGVTVYRDKSRTGVLVSNEPERVNSFEYTNAFKRPVEVECDIYHKTALKQNWMIVVGIINHKPYEIFAFKDVDNHIFPTKIEKGKIIKVKSKTYKLEGILSDKLYSIGNIISLMSPDDKTDTRKYSSMLRHGMRPRYIVEQIQEYATIASFDKVIERVLKNYTNGESIKQDSEKCPECGSELRMGEGCKHCVNCTYSKCG